MICFDTVACVKVCASLPRQGQQCCSAECTVHPNLKNYVLLVVSPSLVGLFSAQNQAQFAMSHVHILVLFITILFFSLSHMWMHNDILYYLLFILLRWCDSGDYDRRTAIHIAAAEGNEKARVSCQATGIGDLYMVHSGIDHPSMILNSTVRNFRGRRKKGRQNRVSKSMIQYKKINPFRNGSQTWHIKLQCVNCRLSVVDRLESRFKLGCLTNSGCQNQFPNGPAKAAPMGSQKPPSAVGAFGHGPSSSTPKEHVVN